MNTEVDEHTGRREPTLQLAAVLRHKIVTGEWEEGRKLPTARDLAAAHEVALTTAVRAVGILRDEGRVITTRGQGSYVKARQEIERRDASRYRYPNPDGLSPNRDEAAAGPYWDEVDLDNRWVMEATPNLANRLNVEPGTPLSAVRYRWRVGGIPTQTSIQWEPLDITEGTSAELPSSATRGQPASYVRFARIGWRINHVDEKYRARMPTPEERNLLELFLSDVPVIEIIRCAQAINSETGEERVTETATIVARGDRVVITSSTDVVAPSNVES